MLLGQDRASSLGVEHDKLALWMLILIAVLISLSTALVGPVSFFGLIVVHLTYRLAGTYQHRFLIPFAALLGIFVLVAGEWVLQRFFSFNTRLSMIIEFLGGLFFLVLIVKQGKA
jgi:iron complex transport system permease protein